MERSALLFAALKLAGAAYLVYLGAKALRHRKALSMAAGETGAARGVLRTLSEGFVVGVSNPKTMVFYAAVLPQFVDRAAGHVTAQMLLLGLVFNVIALASDSTMGLVASAARSWFARSPHAAVDGGRRRGPGHDRPGRDGRRDGAYRLITAPLDRLGGWTTDTRTTQSHWSACATCAAVSTTWTRRWSTCSRNASRRPSRWAS